MPGNRLAPSRHSISQQTGNVQVSVSAGSYTDKTVTFPKPFKTAPLISCFFQRGQANAPASLDHVEFEISNITGSSFMMRVDNGNIYAHDVYLVWQAFGFV